MLLSRPIFCRPTRFASFRCAYVEFYFHIIYSASISISFFHHYRFYLIFFLKISFKLQYQPFTFSLISTTNKMKSFTIFPLFFLLNASDHKKINFMFHNKISDLFKPNDRGKKKIVQLIFGNGEMNRFPILDSNIHYYLIYLDSINDMHKHQSSTFV